MSNSFISRETNVLTSAILMLMFSANIALANSFNVQEFSINNIGKPLKNGLMLYGNGTVGDYFKIQKAGVYKVIIYAYGSKYKGIWPLMSINVNGIAGEIKEVNKNNLSPYNFYIKINKGYHFIGITFLNDAFDSKNEDRNLYCEKFIIRYEGVPVAGTVTKDKDYILRNINKEKTVLSKTNEGIKRNRMTSGNIIVLNQKGVPLPGIALTINQIQHDFLFGCNIFLFNKLRTQKENKLYKDRFQKLFNYATVPLYWRSFETKPNKPNYYYLDKIVKWCIERGIHMKGHPLLWGNELGIPLWSRGLPAIHVQRKRVFEIIHRYNKEIKFWEVVNEPAHLKSIDIGAPYHWAREASSHAYLIINEYGILDLGGYPIFYNKLKDASKRKIPFDGIGIQAHGVKDFALPLDQFQAILDLYATLGKEIHITEFTPTSSGKAVIGSPWRGIWDENLQADYAEKFYRICFSHKAVVAITWWNLTDRKTFRKYGGLLRNDLSEKPAYTALKHLIKEEWQTKYQGKTNGSGMLQFFGYYGSYRVRYKKGGIIKETKIHLEKGKKNTFKLYF